MKRCRKLVMGLSLVLAMTFLIGTTSFAGEYSLCFVNTEGGNLNCRSGPGTEYSIVESSKMELNQDGVFLAVLTLWDENGPMLMEKTSMEN